MRVHRWADDADCPEHFIVSSATSLGIGGGSDGAALFFHDNFQRGTSSARCCAFQGAPELVGRARRGLNHSEFRALRIFIFSLDDSDYVDYVDRREALKFHRAFLAKEHHQEQLRHHHGGADDGDDHEDEDFEHHDHDEERNAFPCEGCKIEPRGSHHACSFLRGRR